VALPQEHPPRRAPPPRPLRPTPPTPQPSQPLLATTYLHLPRPRTALPGAPGGGGGGGGGGGDGVWVADPSAVEEDLADARLTVVLEVAAGGVEASEAAAAAALEEAPYSIQVWGGAPVSPDDAAACLALARRRAAALAGVLAEAVAR